MSKIDPSSIGENDAEFARRISECTNVEQMKDLRDEFLLKKNLVRPDKFNAGVLIPVEQPTVPETVSVTVEVNGVQKTFTGSDSDDLDRQQITYFRTLETASANEQPRSPDGRFTAENGRSDENAARAEEAEAAEIVRKANLEIEFKSGRLSTAEYLAQSGAIEEHLAAKGIDVDVLRAQSAATNRDLQYEQSWASASAEFLKSPAGSDWPGTEAQKMRLGGVLEEMGITDPEVEKRRTKVEHLAVAWGILKARDTQTKALANAKSPQEIDDLLGKADRTRDAMQSRGSGFFGRK